MQSVSVLARQSFLVDARKLMRRMRAAEGPKQEVRTLRMRGEILAAEGKFGEAVDLLEPAVRKESAALPKEYWARILALSGQHSRARIVYSEIVNTRLLIWASPESAWPRLRLLAKRYLQTQKGATWSDYGIYLTRYSNSETL